MFYFTLYNASYCINDKKILHLVQFSILKYFLFFYSTFQIQNLSNFYHIHHDQSSPTHFLSSLNFYNSLQTGLFTLYPFRARCDLAPAIFPQPSQSIFLPVHFAPVLLAFLLFEEAYFYLRAFELVHLALSSLTYLLLLLPHLFQMWPYQRGLPCLLFVKYHLPTSSVLPSIFLICFFSIALNTI